MLLSGLVALDLDLVSLPFLAALYFYPCVDFSVSLLRRWRGGASLAAPDNDHLHNRINTFFQARFLVKKYGELGNRFVYRTGQFRFSFVYLSCR